MADEPTTEATTEPSTPSVHVLMARALRDIVPVRKEGHQSGAGGEFNFRKVDDVLDAVHQVLADHQLFYLPRILERIEEKRAASGNRVQHVVHLHVRFRFFGPRGDYVDASMFGEGADMGDKATSKAATMAMKYALIESFSIPLVDLPDPDAETPPETKAAKAPASRQRPQEPRSGAKAPPKEQPAQVAPGMSNPGQWKSLSILAQKLGWDDAEKHRQAGVETSTKELTFEQARDLAQIWTKLLNDKTRAEREAKKASVPGDDPGPDWTHGEEGGYES